MSTNYCVYLGIYIEVQHKKILVKKESYLNWKTGDPARNRFDPKTGNENTLKIDEVEEELVAGYDMFEEAGLNDGVFNIQTEYEGNFTTFTLDDENCKYHPISINVNSNKNIEVAERNNAKLIEEFKMDYKPYLDIIEETYGPVEIKYGLVVSWR